MGDNSSQEIPQNPLLFLILHTLLHSQTAPLTRQYLHTIKLHFAQLSKTEDPPRSSRNSFPPLSQPPSLSSLRAALSPLLVLSVRPPRILSSSHTGRFAGEAFAAPAGESNGSIPWNGAAGPRSPWTTARSLDLARPRHVEECRGGTCRSTDRNRGFGRRSMIDRAS